MKFAQEIFLKAFEMEGSSYWRKQRVYIIWDCLFFKPLYNVFLIIINELKCNAFF